MATLCYGMNDGSYQSYNEEIGKRYESNMRKILEQLEAAVQKSLVPVKHTLQITPAS